MSFTDQVKHELVRLKGDQLAELSALIRMNGSIQIKNKRFALKIKTNLGDLARKIFTIIKEQFSLKIEILVRKDNHFSGNHNVYELVLQPQEGLDEFLRELGFIDQYNSLVWRIKDDYFHDRESQSAYLRGAFLGGGSVNHPNGEYHLEFRCEHRSLAEDLIKLLATLELDGHAGEHHHKQLVYFKKFEDIVTILNIMGAYQAQLKMEDTYILKDLKNNINRKVNCETANLDKTVQAALLQLEDIRLIEASRGLQSLSASLREIALLRKNNPYASLKELGEMAVPALSKSGVNHRMRRIKKIAEQIRRD